MKIQFTLYTYVLAQILQNGGRFMQKLIPGYKNHMTQLLWLEMTLSSKKASHQVEKYS